jgi:hypothetical protein
MVHSESCCIFRDIDCVFFAANEAAARFSHSDKHLGISGAYYDEHQSADDGGSGNGYFHRSFYSRVAAVLFQRHSFSDVACQIGW